MEVKQKFKPLTKSQLLISIDRLTRFKPTEEKYVRVFKDIILSNLIFPKYKKTELEQMNYSKLTDLAEFVFNSSVQYYTKSDFSDFSINKKLLDYENSVFFNPNEVQILLSNKFDYKGALSLFEGDDFALNIKWLKSISSNLDSKIERLKNGFRFPVEKIVILEGITEEILLPVFAKFYGKDFDKLGIYLISAGGKNQVVKLFYKYARILKLPIFVLLDNDAKSNYVQIGPKLRKNDKIHVLEGGEFEDILPLDLIQRTLNNYLKNFATVSKDELMTDSRMTKNLEEIFKQKGFSEFKKAEFAHMLSENISSDEDLSEEIIQVIKELLN